MTWLFALLELLANTTAQLIGAHRRGASKDEMLSIAAQAAAMQTALIAEQQRVLTEAEKLVPGFRK